jgi:hypothetical protein
MDANTGFQRSQPCLLEPLVARRLTQGAWCRPITDDAGADLKERLIDAESRAAKAHDLERSVAGLHGSCTPTSRYSTLAARFVTFSASLRRHDCKIFLSARRAGQSGLVFKKCLTS